MRKYTPNELHIFLEAVDQRLPLPARINVMGGGAIALAHGVDRDTHDIDVFETNMRAIKRAVERAHRDTGLRIAVSGAGGAVGDVPWNSDERMIHVMPELTRLAVYALEAHDVALSKALRGNDGDFAAIKRLHAKVDLDKDVLVNRYIGEMGHVIGSRWRHDHNIVLLIDKLFGEIEADETKEKLEKRGPV